MATKRNDVQGHRRGARGIDENDGHDFTNTDKMSNDAQFGRSWHHSDTKGCQPVDCDYDEEVTPANDLVRSAQGGQGTQHVTKSTPFSRGETKPKPFNSGGNR